MSRSGRVLGAPLRVQRCFTGPYEEFRNGCRYTIHAQAHDCSGRLSFVTSSTTAGLPAIRTTLENLPGPPQQRAYPQ